MFWHAALEVKCSVERSGGGHSPNPFYPIDFRAKENNLEDQVALRNRGHQDNVVPRPTQAESSPSDIAEVLADARGVHRINVAPV